MALQCGIVGLPNVGKSTLFNALTASAVPAENYPFCTIDPHHGIVALPDARLEVLRAVYRAAKATPATIEFIDIAGLVRGASRGEGLGNRFLGQIRQVAAIIHVVRCFEDENVAHVEGSLDPVRDAGTVATELLLADLETIQKRLDKVSRSAKAGDQQAQAEQHLLERLHNHCNQGNLARTWKAAPEELPGLRSLGLLTAKPILYVANVEEAEFTGTGRSPRVQQLFDVARQEQNLAIRLCGKLEQEIAQLENSEKDLFLKEYNLPEPGLNKLIHAARELLGLLTFFTGNTNEVRAWTVPRGTRAPQAAGEIHTDFEKGFIKAEVCRYGDLVRLGSEKALREAGLVLLEGRDYLVQEGDCILFRFNV